MIFDKFTVSRDSLSIRGEIYRPESGTVPAVIICHGIISDMRSTRGYAEYMVSLGYAAFIFDFAGGGPYSTSDGKMEDMTIAGEVKDLKSVLSYVRSLDYIDASRISLMGLSQGGFVAAIAAGELHNDIYSLALFYPAFCIPDHARSGSMLDAKFDPSNIPEIMPCGKMILGRGYPLGVMDMDAYEIPSLFTKDVLIVHGTADTIVPPQYAKRASEVYSSSKLVMIEGASHGFQNDYEIAARNELRCFFHN